MAKQLENALTGLNPEIGIDGGYNDSNYGDQFSGITITYKVVDGGIKVTSIIADDGQYIDINDNTKTYNVCVNEYCATLEGSVFENLTPIVSMDDAPVDNLSTIDVLRERRDTIGLKMELDTTIHSMTIENKIQQIEETVKEYKGKTVTSADKEAIVRLATEIDALIASGSLSEEEMDTLRSVKSDVSEMLAKIVEEKNNSDNKDNAGNNNTGNQGDAKPSDKINGKGNGSVKTGDTNAVMPWMILLFVSGAGIIGAAEVSRKKQNK